MAKTYFIMSGVLLLCVFLIGCKSAPQQDKNASYIPLKIKNTKPEGSAQGSCTPPEQQKFVGKMYKNVKLEVPPHRWKRHGYKYSQQFVAGRLNIITNKSGMITKINCG